MAASLAGVFPQDLREKILPSKILVVGAGGIGCEILKNLVLSGFPEIEIIDLDTIDLSNLNRQFLFHREHVGKSKAMVAKESALQFNPDVKITAYHDSITSVDYGVNFYKKFNVVLNALDNRAARNHVNRMCLNADVPLIESGTAGYNGQVELIKKGLTQCYECTPKARQKTFPGCTIRNTPSEPIHCIVWAKHLFNQLFGEPSDEEDISPDMADPEAQTENASNGEVIQEAENGKNDNNGNVDRVSTRQWAKECQFDAEKLFNKFFNDDIKYLLSMSNLWKTRKPPAPVPWQKLMEAEEAADVNGNNFERQYHSIWSMLESAQVFKNCLKKLSLRYVALADNDFLSWDKDDQEAMDFVAACANIRSSIFEIPRKSRFEIKSMAGNIIPAIATTNAMTAGVVVLQTFKVLREQYAQCPSVYMRLRQNPRQQLLVPEKNLTPPNPKCIVCAAEPAIHLRVDTNKMKIVELRDDVLKKTLNMVQPELTIESKGIVVISADAEETENNEQKLLSELYIVDGVVLRCDDYVQQYDLSIIIMHFDAKHDEPLFEVIADESQLKPKEEVIEKPAETQKSATAAVDDDDDGPSTSKRARLDTDVVNADDEDEDDCVITEDSDKEEEEAVDKTVDKKVVVESAATAAAEVEPMKVDAPDTTEISDDESGNSPQEIVDLDSETSSSDCYSEETPSPAVLKRKAPLVQEEITVLDSDEEEQEAKIAAATAGPIKKVEEADDDDVGPTPCKRTRLSNNTFNSNEVINID